MRFGPAFAAAVPEIEVGSISDPIYCTGRILSGEPRLLRGGFAVVQVVEREPVRMRTYEEAEDDVRLAYAAQHRNELDRELVDGILGEAGFEILRLPEPGEFLQ